MAQTPQPLSDPLVEQVAHRLLMLGQPTRIRILELLRSEGEMVVQALADALETTQQSVSRHLALLYREGVVERRRQGRLVWYRLADASALGLIEQASEYVVRERRAGARPW